MGFIFFLINQKQNIKFYYLLVSLARVFLLQIGVAIGGFRISTSIASHGAISRGDVMEAALRFGEIAQCFGEWKCRFGHAEIIPAQSLWV
jgi:hypothetical protein